MSLDREDIICARATPAGGSAIAIIRVSGNGSHALLHTIFRKKFNPGSAFKTHRAYYGTIFDNKEIIDDALVITFSEGKSFTGEESFEINSHGSEIVIALILRIICNNGGRLAEPGEFSKRAFLNGKIDLSEAEAIMDVVNASTKQAANIAVKQLNGTVKNEINFIKNLVADLLAEIEVYIDYPEEDLSLDTAVWTGAIDSIITQSKTMLNGFTRGKYIREGIQAAILGKTNAGKSTLFNYLLNEDKAIVSDIHGTTRDYLDGVINISGYGVRLYDTAGLRKTLDPIELEGTKRAISISDKSDIVLYVLSGSEGLTDNDKINIQSISSDKKTIIIVNKIDLIQEKKSQLINEITNFIGNHFIHFRIIGMSAIQKTGIEQFNSQFIELVTNTSITESTDPIITNERHANKLLESINSLSNAKSNMQNEILDLAAFDLRQSLNSLGEITGEITPNDILDKIFSTFCVGK